MEKSEFNIVIIGAGVAGLVAAQHLEAAGFSPTIIEATDRPGGRLKTDEKEGFLLDHGFQVLLTAYREAQTYLDFELLDLQKFDPGAVVYTDRHRYQIGDPIRQPKKLFSTLFSQVGTFNDKLLILRLSESLKRKAPEEIFLKNPGLSTEDYLRKYGFSEQIIHRFFRPFFGGIFLERALSTPATMFRFVFKMFSEGHAALPARGIEAIPQQLCLALESTNFKFHRRVSQVEGQVLRMADGEDIPYDALIIATDASKLVAGLQNQETDYHGTTCLYFQADRPILKGATIALVADVDNPINNFTNLATVAPNYAPPDQHLISVTLKDMRRDDAAVSEAKAALARLTKIPLGAMSFLGRYDIPHALPALPELNYDMQASQTRLSDRIFLAGDQLLNGSLDAAMRSGRQAALGLLQAVSS